MTILVAYLESLLIPSCTIRPTVASSSTWLTFSSWLISWTTWVCDFMMMTCSLHDISCGTWCCKFFTILVKLHFLNIKQAIHLIDVHWLSFDICHHDEWIVFLGKPLKNGIYLILFRYWITNSQEWINKRSNAKHKLRNRLSPFLDHFQFSTQLLHSYLYLWIVVLVHLILYLICMFAWKQSRKDRFKDYRQQPREKCLILHHPFLICFRNKILKAVTSSLKHWWHSRINHHFVQLMWKKHSFNLLIPQQEILLLKFDRKLRSKWVRGARKPYGFHGNLWFLIFYWEVLREILNIHHSFFVTIII